MAAIKDVAKCAGLSVSVVSKYLKNADSVRPDTKFKIEKAIKELGYVPSSAARALRTGKNNMYAVIVPDVTNPYYARLFQGLCMEGRRRGVTMTLQELSAEGKMDDRIRAPQQFGQEYSVPSIQPVDGIIVTILTDREIPRKLAERSGSIPVVPMGWVTTPLEGQPAVLIDMGSGFYELTKHLLSLGHRRIGYIGEHYPEDSPREKYHGYCRAMREAGQPYEAPNTSLYQLPQLQAGIMGTEQLLKRLEPPTAIITETDELAAGCIKAAKLHDLRVPEDLAVTGCDNTKLAALYEPAITSIKMPVDELCVKTLELAIKLSNGADGAQIVSEILTPEIVIRGSTVKGAVSLLDFTG